MITIHDDPSAIKGKPRREQLAICACGHQEPKHTINQFGTLCDGARSTCPCRTWKPVITVPDARVFMYGPGAEGHPLVLGILKTKERGKFEQITWLKEACESCGEPFAAAVYVDNGRASELRCKEHTA